MRVQFVLTVITGLIENLLFSGILFGWPSLEFVLVKEGYFGEHCHLNETTTGTCKSQAASLNLVYYVGIIAMSFTGLPLGYFLDRCGTWKIRTLGTTLLTIGAILLVVSTANLSWCLYPGMFIFITGSIAIFLTNPQTANFFPKIRAVIVNVLDGMLASSACICLLIKIAYGKGYQFRNILLFFLSLTILPWLRTYTLMPQQFIPYPLKNPGIKYGIYEWSKCKKNEVENDTNEETLTLRPVDDNPSESTTDGNKFFKTVLFWTNAYQFGMYALRNIFFDGSMDNWLHSFIANPTKISNLINLYGFLIFFSFFISLVSGSLVDGFTNFYKGKRALYFGLLASTGVTSLLLILLSVGAVAEEPIMSFVFSLLGQGFVYGGATTFIVYAFPMKDFGKIYGVTILIGGILMLLEFGLFKLSLIYDPSFRIANIVLLVLSISTLIHPIAWAKYGITYKLQT